MGKPTSYRWDKTTSGPLIEPTTDALLAALINKLPPAGASWPAAKRAAWLELMWKAFDVVYEADGDAIEMPAFLRPREVVSMPVAASTAPTAVDSAATATAADRPFRQMGGHAFYIDTAGRACRAGGFPIAAAELPPGSTLYDMRGEAGDLGAIQWADGKVGVRGISVDVSAA